MNMPTKKHATFAGGCFWCMVAPFEILEGVEKVISGYEGESDIKPSYEQVATGRTNFREAIQITYNPSLTSYNELLDVFWKNIDPTDKGGQFADRGFQYSSAIFYHDEEQKNMALESKDKVSKSGPYAGEEIVTQILPAQNFFKAEEYHQDYHKKNPLRYKSYRHGSGRAPFLEKKWSSKGEA